jgi:hypothetical protein
MKYYLEPKGNFFSILQEGINEFYVGYVYPLKDDVGGPRFSVRSGDNKEIAVVKSMDETTSALAAYYGTNPPWWQREDARGTLSRRSS